MTLHSIALFIGYLSTIGGAILVMWRAVKKISAIAEGQKCLLRSKIMDIYYKHCDDEEPTLREYERKNLDSLYQAYAGLHGNTFVEDIYQEMRHWRVVS